MSKVSFEELVVERGGIRVTWEWIGEGLSGDYDEAREGDEPRIRFSVDKMVDGAWEGMEDASYCTGLPADTPEVELLKAAAEILEAARQPSPKRIMERLSWMCLDKEGKLDRGQHGS